MNGNQIQLLEELGVNLDITMDRFMQNEDLYFRCLGKFQNDKNFDNMILAIDNKNANDAFEAAHALKGVAANLGLDKLYSQTATIVEVFRAGSLDYDEDNLNVLKSCYNEVLDTIAKM